MRRCVDPLEQDFDGSALAAVLADPAVQLVVHAGPPGHRADPPRLRTEVTNVFDTQVAAGFAGLGAQSSYDSLLSEVLGLRLAKTASFTRWDARPLSQEQIAYAREDVVHLLELAAELEAPPAASSAAWRGRWRSASRSSRSSDERDLENDLRAPAAGRRLSAPASGRSRASSWAGASETAARQDRPVQSVLGDATLVEIARRRPSSRGELERIRGVGGNAGGRSAARSCSPP